MVLATFASSATLTRLELEELTGLSRTVVAGVIASLVARGELAELRQPPTAGTRGRPPSRYQRTALLPPVLLIKLAKDGSTVVSSVRGDGTHGDPHQCAEWSQAWPAWSRSVLEAAGRLRDWAGLPPRAAVLSAPFPVAEAHGGSPRPETAHRVLRAAPWLEDDPGLALSRLLGCTVLVVNDANLAALGEASFGAGRGRRAVFYVTVADGIGAAFVFDGRLFTGAHGLAGELVHVQVDADGAPCVCGNRGCLVTETEVVVRGLRPHPSPGDGEALGSLIGRALSSMVTTLDPDCVVVDPRLAEECRPFIAAFTAELARRCPPGLVGPLTVVSGEFVDAERYGALAAADAHASALVSAGAWPGSSPDVPGANDVLVNNEELAFLRNLRVNLRHTGVSNALTIWHFASRFPQYKLMVNPEVFGRPTRSRSMTAMSSAVMTTKVLIIEDDPNIVDLIRSNLVVRGFDTVVSAGTRVLALLQAEQPDMVLLDLMLPEADGFELCRQIRERSAVAIIIVSARGGEQDKVTALNMGADDYLTKPFGIEELLARISATLRRTRSAAEAEAVTAPTAITVGDLWIDLASKQVRLAGAEVHLTPTEFALLRELAVNRGTLLSRTHLLRRVWGRAYETETEYVRVYISRLRAKLEPPGSPPLIVTHQGTGYRIPA